MWVTKKSDYISLLVSNGRGGGWTGTVWCLLLGLQNHDFLFCPVWISRMVSLHWRVLANQVWITILYLDTYCLPICLAEWLMFISSSEKSINLILVLLEHWAMTNHKNTLIWVVNRNSFCVTAPFGNLIKACVCMRTHIHTYTHLLIFVHLIYYFACSLRNLQTIFWSITMRSRLITTELEHFIF